jgi:polyphosphate kinase
LVTRRGRVLKRYGHLSTGNYNPNTARLAPTLRQTEITEDMDRVQHLASHSRLPRLNKLWIAPFHLHRRLIED